MQVLTPMYSCRCCCKSRRAGFSLAWISANSPPCVVCSIATTVVSSAMLQAIVMVFLSLTVYKMSWARWRTAASQLGATCSILTQKQQIPKPLLWIQGSWLLYAYSHSVSDPCTTISASCPIQNAALPLQAPTWLSLSYWDAVSQSVIMSAAYDARCFQHSGAPLMSRVRLGGCDVH